MIRFSFHVSPKCSGCRYLVADKQINIDVDNFTTVGHDTVIKCVKPDKHCSINEYRDVSVEEVRDEKYV